MKKKILLIDNYDSYTYNLLNLCKQVFKKYKIILLRNRERQILKTLADFLIISPGPMSPSQTAYTLDAVDNFVKNSLPIIGVCLGMQVINEYFSGKTKKSNYPSHGYQAMIAHNDDVYYKNISNPFLVMRYNSLKCAVNEKELVINSWLLKDQFEPMSIVHQKQKIIGLQYHPESFLTPVGETIFKNIHKEFQS